MNLNYLEIGERIRSERNKIGLTQVEIIEKLHHAPYYCEIGRNTFSNIENGRIESLHMDIFIALCDIFGCEIGYLLCQYNERTQELADICPKIGLSETAVNRLLREPIDAGITNYFLNWSQSYRLFRTIYNFCLRVSAEQEASKKFRPANQAKLQSDVIEGCRFEAVREFMDFLDHLYNNNTGDGVYAKLLDFIDVAKVKQ